MPTVEKQLRTQHKVVGHYQRPADDLRLNQQEFRFTALRPDLGNVDISGLVTQADWRDEGTEHSLNVIPVLRGSITVQMPEESQDFELLDGHRVRCDVRWRGEWMHLWEMRLYQPSQALGDGVLTCEVADDLQLLSQSRDTFRYRRGKKKKRNGWRYHEIVIDVCAQYRIPLAEIVLGRARIKNLDGVSNVSPLECIRRAVEEEREYTGRRYVIQWRWSERLKRYALHIVHPRRNYMLYTLADQITGGTIEDVRNKRMATVITARGSGKAPKVSAGKGKGKRKTYKKQIVADGKNGRPDGLAQFGFIHKPLKVRGNIDSLDELEEKATRRLARLLERNVKVDLEHPGIAFMRRGDGLLMNVPELADRDLLAFVVSVQHTLSGGDYTMNLTLGFTDPLDPKKLRAERDKAARARKRKKHSDKKKGKD